MTRIWTLKPDFLIYNFVLECICKNYSKNYYIYNGDSKVFLFIYKKSNI